jgi:hypothetical protein
MLDRGDVVVGAVRHWWARKRLGWKLASLGALRPDQILPPSGRDEVGEFVIALSLASNDLKDVIHMMWWLRRARFPDKVEPYAGEWHGVRAHLERLLASYIHELLVLIDKRRAVLETDEFKAIHARVAENHRALWDELVSVAVGRTKEKSTLERIRNTGSFHYYGTRELGKAFRKFFYSGTRTESNQSAFLSVGRRQSETRLFFADAVAQHELHEKLGVPGGESLVKDLVHRANQGIIGVVAAFVESRGGARPYAE